MDTYPSDIPIIRQPTPARIAELDRLGDEIAELSVHLEAATARLLALIREFDVRGGWANGFRSCAEWLAWRVGLAPGATREHVRVARALGTLPALAEALARGELSYAKVRALTRIATPGRRHACSPWPRGHGRPGRVSSGLAASGSTGRRPRNRTPDAGRGCTSTRMRMAPWCCGRLTRKSARCSCGPSTPPARRLPARRASEAAMAATDPRRRPRPGRSSRLTRGPSGRNRAASRALSRNGRGTLSGSGSRGRGGPC